MKTLTALIVALTLVLSACGGDDVGDTTTTQATTTTEAATTTTAPAPAGTEVVVSDSDLGPILTDGDGNTLYLFIPDAQGDPTCYDACEANWPPLVGDATAGEGTDASLFGTATRTDGSTQVTYNGWPLYYFAADAAPGDTNGQGLNDVWFVLSADGNAVQ